MVDWDVTFLAARTSSTEVPGQHSRWGGFMGEAQSAFATGGFIDDYPLHCLC